MEYQQALTGVHPLLIAAISGSEMDSADSIVMSGGYAHIKPLGRLHNGRIFPNRSIAAARTAMFCLIWELKNLADEDTCLASFYWETTRDVEIV